LLPVLKAQSHGKLNIVVHNNNNNNNNKSSGGKENPPAAKRQTRLTPKWEVPCPVAPATILPSFIQMRPRVSEKAFTTQTSRQTDEQQLYYPAQPTAGG